jgi:hypothetical protein
MLFKPALLSHSMKWQKPVIIIASEGCHAEASGEGGPLQHQAPRPSGYAWHSQPKISKRSISGAA